MIMPIFISIEDFFTYRIFIYAIFTYPLFL